MKYKANLALPSYDICNKSLKKEESCFMAKTLSSKNEDSKTNLIQSFYDSKTPHMKTDDLVNIYFDLKNLVTNEARYVLLKAKYANDQKDKKYKYYSNKLDQTSEKLRTFVNKNKLILDNFVDNIKNFSLPIDKIFFNQMYVYAQNTNSKKTTSKNLYLSSKFDSKKCIDETIKKIEEIKNKNLKRVDLFFKNKNKVLADKDKKIYKDFHINIEKLVVYQKQVVSKFDVYEGCIEKFKNHYKKTMNYYNKHKQNILKMKEGDFASTYCDNILFSTDSMVLLIDILNNTKNSFYLILKKIKVYKLIELESRFDVEVKNNNDIIKELLELSCRLKKLIN
ncbi:hypothetical protein [Alphaproteobacteria bacterium endosymbiont of Tiliacea citrago]|uniref:hypothetical protein n=1 Tax=Alphaproteobacteria bacterium endosymbiont of Tiliacea citrago TaxID=3077944 RepID=UPI00313CB62D